MHVLTYRMKKIVLVLTLVAAIQTGFCQDFTNKLWKKPVSSASSTRLDYFSNWKTVIGEQKTTLYFSYVPKPGSYAFHAIKDWKTVKVRDKATGKEYKVIDGNGITLRNDAVFAFHCNNGHEIGFSLDFEPMPSTVRNIDVIFLDDKWFADVPLDPARHYNDPVFRLHYMLRTISFYTTVNRVISFNFDNTVQSDMVIRTYYEKSYPPRDCTAGGTLTLAFPIAEQETPFSVYAYYFIGEDKKYWQFTATPSIGCEMISLSAN